MRINNFLTTGVLLGFAVTVTAAPVNFTFLENGLGNLGSSSTFTESGISLTAYAGPSGQQLYAKNEGPGETGLGTASDSQFEINPNNFVQLNAATSPATEITTLYFGSIQTATLGEKVDIYYSTTLGTLGTLLGTVSGVGSSVTGSFDLTGWGYTSGYYGITAGQGNIELGGATVNSLTVPDAASTAALLGGAVMTLGCLRRKLMV
jgi:hypothetical protein